MQKRFTNTREWGLETFLCILTHEYSKSEMVKKHTLMLMIIDTNECITGIAFPTWCAFLSASMYINMKFPLSLCTPNYYKTFNFRQNYALRAQAQTLRNCAISCIVILSDCIVFVVFIVWNLCCCLQNTKQKFCLLWWQQYE